MSTTYSVERTEPDGTFWTTEHTTRRAALMNYVLAPRDEEDVRVVAIDSATGIRTLIHA